VKYYDNPEAWKREVDEIIIQCSGQTIRALTAVGFEQREAEELEPILNVNVRTYLARFALTDIKALVSNETDAEEMDQFMGKLLREAREQRTSMRDALLLHLKYQSIRHRGVEVAPFDMLKSMVYESAASCLSR